jgi:MFS family permease
MTPHRHILERISGYVRDVTGFSRPAKLVLLSCLLISPGYAPFVVLFNLYLKRLGYGEAFIGDLVSVTALATVLTALALGFLGDRVSRRWLFRIGVATQGLGLAARSLLTGRAGLLASTVVAGISFPLWHIAYIPLLTAYSREEERTHLFSVVAATWLVAGVLGNGLAGALPGFYAALTGVQTEGIPAYRSALLVGAGFYGLGLLPLLFLPPEERQRQDESTEQPAAPSRVVSGQIAAFTAVAALLAFGERMILPFLNLFFKERLGAEASVIGLIFAGARIVAFAATFLVPALTRRWGQVRTVTGLRLAFLPFLAGMALAPSLGLVVPFYYAWSALWNMVLPPVRVFQMALIPENQRVRVTSLAGQGSGVAQSLAGAAAAALAGRLILHLGYPAVYLLTIPFFFVGTLMYYAMFKRYERIERRGTRAAR